MLCFDFEVWGWPLYAVWLDLVGCSCFSDFLKFMNLGLFAFVVVGVLFICLPSLFS